MITDDQAKRLLKLIEEEEKNCYLFMNEQDAILATEFFTTDSEALSYGRTLSIGRVNILRHIGIADNTEEVYETF